MNRKNLETTRKTPFLANYSKELDMFLEPLTELNAEKVIILANDIKKLYT